MKNLRLILGSAAAALLLAATPLCVLAQEEPLVPTSPAIPPAAGTLMAPQSVIHPGDQLAIAVYGDPSLTQNATVQADGTIAYPLVGRVDVGGKTPDQARAALANALMRYVKHPQVTLAIAQSGSISVLVMGNIKSPGKYTVISGAHITEAIASAGGIASMNGEYPTARISEPDGEMKTANLQSLLVKGDQTQHVVLENNAIVYVTGAETIRVQVLGAVTRPGVVEVHQGDRLSMALARAGTEAASKPDLNRVYITRRDAVTGKTQSYQVNVFKALQESDQKFDPILQKDDTVYVPEARSMNMAAIGALGLLGHFIGF